MDACLQKLVNSQSSKEFPFQDLLNPELLMVDPIDAALGRGGQAQIFKGHLRGTLAQAHISVNPF